MSGNAGELFDTMKVRLKMQESGLTNPSESVKITTKALVKKLAAIDPSERIETSSGGASIVTYIRVSTGEVLAEITEV